MAEVRGIVWDYVRMSNIKRASVMELGQLIFQPAGRSDYLHEEEVWGEDPVHMTSTGYKLAAEGLESVIYEKRMRNLDRGPPKKPRVDPALRRPDWVRGSVSEAVRLDGRGQMGPPPQRKNWRGSNRGQSGHNRPYGNYRYGSSHFTARGRGSDRGRGMERGRGSERGNRPYRGGLMQRHPPMLPLQHQWMPLQQLQLLIAKKQKWLYWRGEQAQGHKPLPVEEVLKHQMFCGAQSQPCQSWRSAGCPKKEKRRKKKNAERSWNWIWSPPCQSQTKSKSISCPVNKGLLVPSAYQETMIQHILYVFVVVANFYASYLIICDVLVFQSKKN